jgi:hypothetical protein
VSSRVAPVVGLAFALCSRTVGQTLTVPIDSKSVTPDGRPVTVSGQVTVTIGPAPVPVAVYGPRDPVGADVPLSADEAVSLARRVTVQGLTAQAIQSACDSAKATGVPVVYLPAGTYTLSAFVNVPGGLTLLGAGSSTILKPATPYVEMLYTRGDNVRYSRLKMVGPAATSWLQGDRDITARAIEAWGNQNVRVDHCDISGFAYAVLYQNNATGQVDHCALHHNQVIGYGYGVSVAAGSKVAVTDNTFSDNRHSLASNGGGARPTSWDFSHNSVTMVTPSIYQQAQVDTHAGFDGTFSVGANAFSGVDTAVGLYNGSGTISGNRIETSDQGIKIYTTSVHDVAITGTVLSTVRVPYSVVAGAPRITIEGAPAARAGRAVRKKR